ncbi:MAG: hypothetical protein RLP02_02995, partial [Coleofasciculus sp. C2-GNP5-27]
YDGYFGSFGDVGEFGDYGEDVDVGEDGEVNSTISQGGFCRNVIINKEKIVPKPAPTCSCAIPRRSERSKFNTQN